MYVLGVHLAVTFLFALDAHVLGQKIIPARDPKQWGGEKEARLVVVMMMTMTHR